MTCLGSLRKQTEELVAMVATLQALLLQDGPNLALAGSCNTGNLDREAKEAVRSRMCPVMGRDQQRCSSRLFDYF